MRECPTCGGTDIIMVDGQWLCAADETVVPDADLAPVPAPAAKVYEKKGDGYTCQFCGQTFPAAQWNDRGQVCPNLKCAQPYNSLLEQDGQE